MITVPEVTEEIIKRSPFLEDGLSRDIVNLSSLARIIQPQIQDKLLKEIKLGAIVMALKRISARLKKESSDLKPIFEKISDLTVRSNIIYNTFDNSPEMLEKQQILLQKASQEKTAFLTFTQGVFETAIFASSVLEKDIKEIFKSENLRFHTNDLSSITIILPEEAVEIPGVYYSILKVLAWEGINFVEVISSFTELTIFLNSNKVDRAFSALKQLG